MTTDAVFSLPFLDNAMSKLDSFFSKLRWVSILSMLVLPILISIDVICRFFGISVPGSIELQQNLLVLNTFALLGLLQIRRGHMGIDLTYDRMPLGMKRWSDVFVNTLSVLVLVVMVYETCHAFMVKAGSSQLSMELYIPMEYYYWMPVFGLVSAIVVALPQLVRSLFQCMLQKHFLALILGLVCAIGLAYLPFWYREASFSMSNLALGGIAFFLLFLFLCARMPIVWAMCIVGALGMVAISRNIPAAIAAVGTTAYTATGNYNFVALPLFVLMGTLILYSGISKDLFDSASKWIGHYPGGIGIASVAGCTGFSAVCGDSMATAVTMGSVALPEMERLKYDRRLSTGLLAAGGTLGILIPPSTGFIIYGIVTEVSIGRLFLAGIFPGLLLAFLFGLYVYLVAKRKPHMAPSGPRYPMRERIASSFGLLPILGIFFLVLGSIVMGICSPNEGGAVGAMGSFLYALSRGKMTRANLTEALAVAGNLSARIMAIMIGVAILGYFFAGTRLPFLLADFITSLPFDRYIVFAIVVIIYVVLGTVMNVIPMLMLTLPSIFPTMCDPNIGLGFDPIWFGVISVMVMEMGQITPPVGVVVFALAGVAKGIPMETIFRGIFPFVGLIIVGVIIITFFPELATWLPYLLMGREM